MLSQIRRQDHVDHQLPDLFVLLEREAREDILLGFVQLSEGGRDVEVLKGRFIVVHQTQLVVGA